MLRHQHMRILCTRTINRRQKNMKKIKHTIISFALLVLVWQLVYSFGNGNPVLFPSPGKVITAFQELVQQGLPGSTSDTTLFGHILVSLGRFLRGYLFAALCGVLLGLVLGCLPNVFAYINPVLQLIRPVAPVAFLPFIVLLFGIGDVPAIVIIFIAGFFPILLATVSAVQNVEEIYWKVAKSYNLSPIVTIFKIIFPAAFSPIVTSLHLALGTSWIFLVSGEMVGAQSGLGFLIMDTKNCMRMDSLLATIITIGLIGLMLDGGMRILETQIQKRFGYGERK